MVNTRARSIAILLGVVLAGCATAPSRPLRTGFEDIPIPKGLAYHAGDSMTVESPSVKAGHLVYRGRLEPESLRLAMQQNLEANGWRHLSTASTSGRGTSQAYEKGRESLQVQIYEGLWYTYVVLDVSRRQLAAPPAAAGGPIEEGVGSLSRDAAGEVVAQARPRGTWETIKNNTISFGQRVGDFFGNLFSGL